MSFCRWRLATYDRDIFANKIFPKFVQLPVKQKIRKKFEQLSFDLENGHVITIALSARSVYMVRDVIILRYDDTGV